MEFWIRFIRKLGRKGHFLLQVEALSSTLGRR